MAKMREGPGKVSINTCSARALFWISMREAAVVYGLTRPARGYCNSARFSGRRVLVRQRDAELTRPERSAAAGTPDAQTEAHVRGSIDATTAADLQHGAGSNDYGKPEEHCAYSSSGFCRRITMHHPSVGLLHCGPNLQSGASLPGELGPSLSKANSPRWRLLMRCGSPTRR